MVGDLQSNLHITAALILLVSVSKTWWLFAKLMRLWLSGVPWAVDNQHLLRLRSPRGISLVTNQCLYQEVGRHCVILLTRSIPQDWLPGSTTANAFVCSILDPHNLSIAAMVLLLDAYKSLSILKISRYTNPPIIQVDLLWRFIQT
jgi:hypothetical protein